MELIKNFGIDPILLGAQIVNFLIVLFILRWFLYKPVLEMLKKRKDSIKEGLEKAEEARIRLEKVVEEEKNILKKAQAQAKKVVDDARVQAEDSSRQIEESTKKHAEKIFKEAKEQIDHQSLEAEKRLTLHISTLAVEFLQKSARQLFSEKEQKEVMENALKKLKVEI